MINYITFSIIILTMYSEELMVLAMQLAIAISMGLLGAVTRIALQYRRDGELPSDGLSLYFEALLGCVAGLIAWLVETPDDLRTLALFALGLGYTAPDAIENWLAKK